jgi:hypothetical protein
MRKLTALCFALLITVSAAAAPPNDSSARSGPSLITRIVRQIKIVIRALDEIQPGVPVPQTPNP